MAINANGYPGIYNATPPTLGDGEGSPLAVNANGELLVNLEAATVNIGNIRPDNYAVDDTAMPATPNIFPVGGEYRASPTTYTDGDATVLQTDVNGALKVSGGGMIDDAAFTVGTTGVTPAGGTYKSTRDAVDDNDAGALAMTAKRGLYTSLETPLADSAMDDTYDAVKTIPSAYATDDSAMPATPVTMPASAEYRASNTTYTDGDATVLQSDVNGMLRTREQYVDGYIDNTNNVAKVEERFSYSAIAVADVQIKASAGFLHTVTISCADAAPTAGDFKIFDNTAESGTVVFHHNFAITPFVPFTIILDYIMATGIYFGFTTTADVNVSCSFR